MSSIAEHVERMRLWAEEHERRLLEDPEYRANAERQQAELARHQLEEAEEAERVRLAALEGRRQKMEIPSKYRAEIDRADDSELVLAARHFLAATEPHTFLFLASTYGVGKTTAACIFLDAPYEKEATRTREARPLGRFVKAQELVNASAWSEEFWAPLRAARRLVIDDLGQERHDTTGRSMANVISLLCARYDEGAKTIITMNLTASQFRQTYCQEDGGRLADRLRETAIFREFNGASRRRPVGAP